MQVAALLTYIQQKMGGKYNKINNDTHSKVFSYSTF